MKLSLHKYMNHQGEVSWHQYSSSIRNVLVSKIIEILFWLFILVSFLFLSLIPGMKTQTHSWRLLTSQKTEKKLINHTSLNTSLKVLTKSTRATVRSLFLSLVSDLAMGHLAGYAFGGLRPHAPQEHVENPNVLVIHSMKVWVDRILIMS